MPTSRYDNDPRVRKHPNGTFTLTTDGSDQQVRPVIAGWVVGGRDGYSMGDGVPMLFADPEDAIHATLGEPQS